MVLNDFYQDKETWFSQILINSLRKTTFVCY